MPRVREGGGAMSMLSKQIAELRDAAELYDNMIEPKTAALLRGAADAIESLRGHVQECASCTERQGHYEDAETIHAQQAHIDKLLSLNGELCAEVNAKAVRIRELESLARDTYDAWCFECDPWVDDFACAWFDGGECSIRRRMEELGIEVGE